MITPDERGGLPSMSSLGRILECPGSLNAAKGFDYRAPEKSWSADGTAVHDVLSGEEDEDSLDSREDLQEAARHCREVEQGIAETLGFTGAPKMIEERLWLHDDAGDPVISGQFDLVYINGAVGLISDYKTGRKDVLPPALNPQLIGYALLVQEAYGINEFYTAIIPAWRKVPPVGKIDAQGLYAWRAHILDGLLAAKEPDAPRVAGSWCDYCPARPICPQAHAIVVEADNFSPIDQVDSAEELERYDKCKHAAGTVKVYLEYLGERLKTDPDAVPGLRRKPDGETFALPGSVELIQRLQAQGFTTEQLALASKFSINSLASQSIGGKASVKTLTKDGKQAKASIRAAIEDLAKVGVKAGSLERC